MGLFVFLGYTKEGQQKINLFESFLTAAVFAVGFGLLLLRGPWGLFTLGGLGFIALGAYCGRCALDLYPQTQALDDDLVTSLQGASWPELAEDL